MAEPALSRWGVHSDLDATHPGARFDAVVVIPVFHLTPALTPLLAAVLAQELRCILVDDGSEPACATLLDDLVRQHAGVVKLIRLPRRQGRGCALAAGLHEAHRRGYTHALQMDADGRHDAQHIPDFLSLARLQPDALICGCPSVAARTQPGHRAFTRFWVGVNTLSADIRDASCGFRVYPLASTVDVIARVSLSRHLGFDAELLVRMYWRGVHVINHPTRIRDTGAAGPSLGWRDHLQCLRMHSRLFAGMLLRLPVLLWRSARRPRPRLL